MPAFCVTVPCDGAVLDWTVRLEPESLPSTPGAGVTSGVLTGVVP